jgi:hypothetical protein
MLKSGGAAVYLTQEHLHHLSPSLDEGGKRGQATASFRDTIKHPRWQRLWLYRWAASDIGWKKGT